MSQVMMCCVCWEYVNQYCKWRWITMDLFTTLSNHISCEKLGGWLSFRELSAGWHKTVAKQWTYWTPEPITSFTSPSRRCCHTLLHSVIPLLHLHYFVLHYFRLLYTLCTILLLSICHWIYRWIYQYHVYCLLSEVHVNQKFQWALVHMTIN